MFEAQREELFCNIEHAHNGYYRTEIFGGPSLHFHLKALSAARNREFEDFCQFSYAMLASWGMHRMGRGGSKMCGFDIYRSSIEFIWPTALEMQIVSPGVLGQEDWQKLKWLFKTTRCMASATSLVGNSKVLAHLLPNLFPPIDREYTLKFLFKHGRISNDIEKEWDIFSLVLREFFYPTISRIDLEERFDHWIGEPEFAWDTSRLKVLDNLIIGAMRNRKA